MCTPACTWSSARLRQPDKEWTLPGMQVNMLEMRTHLFYQFVSEFSLFECMFVCHVLNGVSNQGPELDEYTTDRSKTTVSLSSFSSSVGVFDSLLTLLRLRTTFCINCQPSCTVQLCVFSLSRCALTQLPKQSHSSKVKCQSQQFTSQPKVGGPSICEQ